MGVGTKDLSVSKAIALFGGVVAFGITYVRGLQNTKFPDAIPILEQAYGITKGWAFMSSHPLLESNPLHLQFPSGLPLILAFTFLITHSTSLFFFKILLAIGHGFSVYLVARIGQEIQLKHIYWVLAAIGFSIDPFILSAATDVQTESITTLIVLWWAFLYITPIISKSQTLFRIIGFPITGFIAIAVRPNILVPFLLITIIMFIRWYHDSLKSRLILASAFIFVSLFTLFEVFLTRLYNGFVLLAPNGGINSVLTCRTEFIPQYLGIASNVENTRINSWYYAYLQELTTKLLSRQDVLSIPALNHDLYSAGISSCLANPISSFGVLLLKVFAIWRPFAVVGAYDLKVFLLGAFLWVPMTLAAIWYLSNLKLSKTNRLLQTYFAALAIGFTISLLPAATQIRHRIAFAEPFYWLFLLFFISQILAKMIESQKRQR